MAIISYNLTHNNTNFRIDFDINRTHYSSVIIHSYWPNIYLIKDDYSGIDWNSGKNRPLPSDLKAEIDILFRKVKMSAFS